MRRRRFTLPARPPLNVVSITDVWISESDLKNLDIGTSSFGHSLSTNNNIFTEPYQQLQTTLLANIHKHFMHD
jgi:hypothetical protein